MSVDAIRSGLTSLRENQRSACPILRYFAKGGNRDSPLTTFRTEEPRISSVLPTLRRKREGMGHPTPVVR